MSVITVAQWCEDNYCDWFIRHSITLRHRGLLPEGILAAGRSSSQPWHCLLLPETWRPSAPPQQQSPWPWPLLRPLPQQPWPSEAELGAGHPCCKMSVIIIFCTLNGLHKVKHKFNSHFHSLHFDTPGTCCFIQSTLELVVL